MYKNIPNANAEEEARAMLAIYDDGAKTLPAILKVFQEQFGTIQTRTQMLITVGTITLSITGFSGYRIKEAGLLAQSFMASGLALVIAAMILILLVSFRVRWVTQFCAKDDFDKIVKIIRYRNWRTRMYLVELTLLLAGISLYSTSLMLYVLSPNGVS